jgi:hypothetical protein
MVVKRFTVVVFVTLFFFGIRMGLCCIGIYAGEVYH